MNRLKAFMQDFPTLGGAVVVALFHFFVLGVLVEVRFVRGLPFPVGYQPWLWFLGALATGTFAAMIGKRMTDWGYAKATNPTPVVAPAATTTTAVTTSTSTTGPAAVAVPADDGAVG